MTSNNVLTLGNCKKIYFKKQQQTKKKQKKKSQEEVISIKLMMHLLSSTKNRKSKMHLALLIEIRICNATPGWQLRRLRNYYSNDPTLDLTIFKLFIYKKLV